VVRTVSASPAVSMPGHSGLTQAFVSAIEMALRIPRSRPVLGTFRHHVSGPDNEMFGAPERIRTSDPQIRSLITSIVLIGLFATVSRICRIHLSSYEESLFCGG
jgi:hypothetical protein